jgi:IclR family KDG regulon transcriptional repressor
MEERNMLVQTVTKAVQIMEMLDDKGAMRMRESAKSLDISKSSVHRIVMTLKHSGWIIENPSTGKIELSYKLFSIGCNVVKRFPQREIIHQHMEELSNATGENVNLGVLFEGRIFHIDKVESNSPIRVDASLGTPTTSYNTALGKVLLAEKSDEEVIEILKDVVFIKTGVNTIMSLPALLKNLEVVRKQGYACDDEEFAEDMICFAVPIRTSEGKATKALSVSFPKYRYENRSEGKERILKLLIKTGERLSKLF